MGELKKTESIDIMDAVGSAIRIDSRGMKVLRILPRLNEEWISDKTRFACDGLSSQRIDNPYVRKENGLLEKTSWEEACATIYDNLKSLSGDLIGGIIGK